MGQAVLEMSAKGDGLEVEVRTFTPNLKGFEARMDAGEWKAMESGFVWKPAGSGGRSELEVRTVNEFGVYGPLSRVVLEVVE